MNTAFRKNLPGTTLDYFDTQAAVEAIKPGAWATLPYTSRVHAENIVRRADPAIVNDCLTQLIGASVTSTSPGSRPAWPATTSWARRLWWTWPACAMPSPRKAATPPR